MFDSRYPPQNKTTKYHRNDTFDVTVIEPIVNNKTNSFNIGLRREDIYFILVVNGDD